MIKDIKIFTRSRHYNLPTDEMLNKPPRSLNIPGLTYYGDSDDDLLYYKNKYVIEKRRDCKPVYLIPYVAKNHSVQKQIMQRSGAPWLLYWNPTNVIRCKFFQQWEENIL